MIQVFKIVHNLCSELTSSTWAIQRTTNEPTTSNYKSDRP